MNNISFQGRSSLIFNPKAYDKAIVITTGAYRHLGVNNKRKLTNGKVLTAEADAQNLAVIVRNERDGITKHIPLNGRIEQTIDEIARKVEELKAAAKGKLTAWIIGGESVKSPNGEKTVEAVNKVADIICDKPDIDTSILAGSLKGDDKIVIHTKNNFLEIILDKDLKLNSKNQKPEAADLEKYFDIVELNNTDLSTVI